MDDIKLVTEGNSLRNAFGQALVELADDYEFKVFDSDVAGGTGAAKFRDVYPDRFKQCGIAEQGMVTAAAGYAKASGQTVFATTFANFGLRALEPFMLSVAYDRAPVILALSHVGLDVGPDGASAQALNYYSVWRSIPGITVIHPADSLEMRQAVKWLLDNPQPAVLLTGRSETPDCLSEGYEYEHSRAQCVYLCNSYGQPIRLHIVASGMMVHRAIEAAQQLFEGQNGGGVMVWNASTIKPFDLRAAQVWSHDPAVLVCEDHSINGGLYGTVCEAICRFGGTRVGSVSTHDAWGQSGESDELATAYGLDADSIARAARELMQVDK